jgi:assimilatory nitrate reductase catalytic subunit
MSLSPEDLLATQQRFGPHLAYSTGARLETGIEPDNLVKTHCCFCGQQCGIQLKVKDNEVIGFEPWEDFPFNRGMLCPKGVKRYLQGSHPDRLLRAYKRDPAADGGFHEMAYDEAIDRVAAEIQRIQTTHGNDAFGVLTGASLTTEKAYLMGKFARMCLKTANIDYNGRLCMVSAGAANKKAFGIDRAANPWSDILKAEVVWISGANIAECAPITTNYVWQAREYGAKIIVVDPRITPIARTCDLFLPIKPGRDIALFNGILHLMIENDWLDHDFINQHTVCFDSVA